ncbi:hypothetical protein K450DRAFT_234487 [Umbelopsis ramanniana AG]|uniref:Uncharacterized protein n=1 Tax=Umbelopsis ramanniana AG TaxID=1314678 RepID=A0AAD5HE67_UMBRA|nr:uncharacterized protein K450DRAFT_234487 [Umbelopsis ramanniana AG]KAI8581070.1 hypothetical protein K450DRAFT_234487 [Umbelopsis ramanniana AG]
MGRLVFESVLAFVLFVRAIIFIYFLRQKPIKLPQCKPLTWACTAFICTETNTELMSKQQII